MMPASATENPVANFTADLTSGTAPFTVNFTDQSTGATSWSWDFDGNGIEDSTEQNPQHTFYPGNYTVNLTVSNSAGSDTESKEDYIGVIGPYSTAMANENPGAPDPGIPGFVGLNDDVNPIFITWASTVVDYSPANQGQGIGSGFSDPGRTLGPVTGDNFDIVSLGDLDQDQINAGERPGSITLGFDLPIANGEGPDLAVFENGFGAETIFAELGYVEVSTDGIVFARFPSISLTPGLVGGYGNINATDVYNLAGKHANAYGASWGTPFDLSTLAQAPEVLNGSVDLNSINYVRIVDIPGSGDFKDSLGNPIYDAWVTWGSGGLDLEAVGVINVGEVSAPVANFTSDVTSGTAPLTVQFSDASTGVIFDYAWDFDNDGIVDSTLQNPSFTYEAPGTYNVSLTISNPGGSRTETKAGYIVSVLPDSPVADFSVDLTNGSVPLTVQFTDLTTNKPISWAWDFESDGIIDSYEQNPSWTYNAAGNYTVTLNATNLVASDTVTKVNLTSVENLPPMADFSSDPVAILIGCSVQFTDLSTNSPTSWQWDFNNDGIIDSTMQNPSYTYTTAGTYTVNLTVSNPAGSGDKVKSGYITVKEQASPASDFTYTSDGSSITLTKYTGSDGIVIIPAEIEGLPVTTIGANAFQSCSALTTVTIPNSVITIGASAFSDCSGLTSLSIPDSVTTIGASAFSDCSGLTSLSIPDSVTTIGTSAFSDCSGLTTLSIPNNVTSIGNYMFQGCSGLTSLIIPNNVTTIGTSAFSDCSGLTTFRIPNNVTTIGASAFSDCFGLTTLSIGSGVTYIVSSAFSGCSALTAINVDTNNSLYSSIDGILYDKDIKTLIQCPSGKTGSLTIPDSVTRIDDFAFHDCTNLTSLIIGNSVTSIGTSAFRDCTNLTSMTIGNSVTSIGNFAFRGCSALTTVTIPDSVSSIGIYAFMGCISLTSANIGSGVRGIGTNAFSDCPALAAINVDTNNSLYSSVGGILYDKDIKTLIQCPSGKTGYVIIPDSVNSIGDFAFCDCTNLTSMIIGNSVISIGTSAFRDCTNLTSMTIGNSVTSIGTSAFRDCTALTSLIISDSVTSIGTSAFRDCTNLSSVVFMGNAPEVASKWAYGLTDLVVYYQPDATGFTTPTWNDVSCYPISAPTAEFTSNVIYGSAPFTVQFTDLSTSNGTTTWAWDFNSDGVVDSTEQNPAYTYISPGNYTVILTVSNTCGSNTSTKENYVTVLAAPSSSSSDKDTWYQFMKDAQHIGYSTSDAPDTNTLLWRSSKLCDEFTLVPSSSVAVADGKVFANAILGPVDEDCNPEEGAIGQLVAFSMYNGKKYWNTTIAVPELGSWSSPVYDNGFVFTSTGKNTTCINASTGTIKWSFTNPSGHASCNGGPVVADGKVLCSDWDGLHYYCLDETTGSELWSYTVSSSGSYTQGTPAISNGKIILTSWTEIYCLDMNGNLQWTKSNPSSGNICGSPTISGSMFYLTTYSFGSDSGLSLFAFALENGTEIWNATIQRTDSTPAIADGYLYICGGCTGYSESQTYCFDALNGTLIWSTPKEDQGIGDWTCSVAVADGKVFVGKSAGSSFGHKGLYALDASTGTELWYSDYAGDSPAIAADTVFSIGKDSDGVAYLYAFQDEESVSPVTDFSVDITFGAAPLTVNFTDLSTNAKSWSWDFNGDGVEDSTDQNPSYEYTTAGTYSVKLTVSNAAGSDEELKENYIKVLSAGSEEGSNVSLNTTIFPAISFRVSPSSVDFGELSPGTVSASQNLTLKNSGGYNLKVTAEVTDNLEGGNLYTSGLWLDSALWSSFYKDIESRSQADTSVSLHVPANYTGTENKQGTITFWVEAAE